MKIFKCIVDGELENMRVDRYIKKLCRNESVSRIFKAFKNGDIRVNGKKIKENYRLLLNDIITVKYLNITPENKKYEKKINIKNIDVNAYKQMIIFENEDFFIVDKPGDIPMHKGTGHEYGISEIYKNIFGNDNINFANRIDSETSGLVIGCKTKKYLRYISEKIRNNKVIKKYIAAVHGKIDKDSFTLENYLVITENGVKVSDFQNEKAKRSVSHFKRAPDVELKLVDMENTILDIDLVTGRKHQIRVQLSHIGHPIIGDKKYGIKDGSKKFYLCCYEIAFDTYNFSIKNKVFR